MARIEWTSYQFNEPSLINETDYNSIKINQKANPNYNPFYVETFYNKFKVGILGYIIGGPVATFLFSVGEELSDSDAVLLEYFGDRVVKLVTSMYLFYRYPDEDEGFMTRLQTKIEDKTSLARFSRIFIESI